MEIIIYSSTCAGIRFSHRPCLRSLRRTIVATEALTIHIVVVVLTVIRLVKRLVIFLDSLQLLAIFFLVVHRQAVSLIACIRYSSWVCLLCSPIYAAFLILLQILSYSLIVYGYQLFNVVLSSLLLTAFNTHIRVMMNTHIRGNARYPYMGVGTYPCMGKFKLFIYGSP